MENEELKKILDQLPIPKHGSESKSKALTSALAEFRNHAQKKKNKFKGFLLLSRLMNKKQTGGSFMQRQITITAGIAVGVIAFSIVLSTYMITNMATPVVPDKNSATLVQKAPTAFTKPAESKAIVQKTNGNLLAAKGDASSNLKSAMPELPAQTLNKKSVVKYQAPVVVSGEVKANEAMPTVNEAQAVTDEKIAASPPASIIMVSPMKQETVILKNQSYVGQDKFENTKPNPVKLVSDEPVSTFSIDVDTASYAFVRRALNNGYLPQADSVRIEEMINYFDYDYPLPKDKSDPFKPTISIFPTPWNSNTKLLHIGIKGYEIVPEKKPRSNLVFLIDVSGSMQSDDKLPLVKNSLRMLINTLKADDTVAIVTYAGAAGTALERTKASEKAKILATIDRLEAGGSTAGGEGISLAYSLAETNMDTNGVNRVILATDGDFNVGISNPEALKDFVARKRKSGVYLSVLGFGQGNYNDALMQKLAQNGNGNAAYIDNLNEARKVLVDEASSTLFTIAKDVKIQVEFNPSMVSEYRLIGYETRQLNREDFKNDNVDAGDIGSGHSVTAIYEITPKGSDAQLIDDLRYGSKKDSTGVKATGTSSEYAFLKIRYKLPDEDSSREIQTSIDKSNEYKKISDAPADSRFAAAVAAFGQILKDDSHINRYTYDDVITLARDSVKDDTFGYRAEFLNLVRLAKTASPMGDR